MYTCSMFNSTKMVLTISYVDSAKSRKFLCLVLGQYYFLVFQTTSDATVLFYYLVEYVGTK
jgi:hypothetical protein